MPVFLATIVYETKDGETRTIEALVMAADEQDAISGAVDAVRSLPHCANVLGGMLEPVGEEEPKRAEPIARSIAGQTVH